MQYIDNRYNCGGGAFGKLDFLPYFFIKLKELFKRSGDFTKMKNDARFQNLHINQFSEMFALKYLY
jgi:hypothetical protein